MKAYIFAALAFCVPAQAEKDFFGLPVTPVPRATPAPSPANAKERTAPPPATWPVPEGATDEIKAMLDKFGQEFSKVSAAEATTLAPVKGAYIKELEKQKEAAKARVDLNGVIAAEAAIQAARDGKYAPPGRPVAGIEQLRANYEKSKAQALRVYEPQRSRLEADYKRMMNELEQRYLRAGNLDAAKQARDVRLTPMVGLSVDVMPGMLGEHETRESYFVVKDDDQHLRTAAAFQPPIEIEYVFKTDGQIRFGYACDELIFNWESNRSELRIGGGPANGQHRPGLGSIPTKQVLNVKQVILPDQMIVSVDGKERARWSGSFSGINEPVELWGSHGSTVWIKQVIIRKLP